MFAKLLTALVLAVVIGSAVFTLRQQRLELMHEIAGLHGQMNRDRQATWDTQVRIAEHTGPEALNEALTRVGLEMEPAATQVPVQDVQDDPAAPFADANYER